MTEEQAKKAVNGSFQMAAERDPEFSSALLAWAETHGYTENLQNFLAVAIAVVISRLDPQQE